MTRRIPDAIDGKYWVLYSDGELLGVVTDENKVAQALWTAYRTDGNGTADDTHCTTLARDMIWLTVNGARQETYYAVNAHEIGA